VTAFDTKLTAIIAVGDKNLSEAKDIIVNALAEAGFDPHIILLERKVMNQAQAFVDTLTFAQKAGMADCEFDIAEVNYWHLQDMVEQIIRDPARFSEGKLGRWLGWAQACVVAGGYGTLQDMKAINKRNSTEAQR